MTKQNEMSKAQLRKKYGVTRQPIEGTRVMAKEMDHDFGVPAHSLLVINDNEGTVTSANVYGEPSDCHTGKGYDPEPMTHPLPQDGDPKWKVWSKRGYEDVAIGKFDVVKAIKAEKAEKEVVTA